MGGGGPSVFRLRLGPCLFPTACSADVRSRVICDKLQIVSTAAQESREGGKKKTKEEEREIGRWGRKEETSGSHSPRGHLSVEELVHRLCVPARRARKYFRSSSVTLATESVSW